MLNRTGQLQGEKWKDKSLNAWEFKIQGALWVALGEGRVAAGLVLLRMMETLEGCGWSLYASINQTGQSRRTDSWFCVRKIGWHI